MNSLHVEAFLLPFGFRLRKNAIVSVRGEMRSPFSALVVFSCGVNCSTQADFCCSRLKK
jgi:hypothetical protein